MKTSHISRLLVQLVAASQVALAKIAIDFGDYCESNTITVSGTILSASCRDITGSYVCTTLDLNTCIKNVGGSLQADPSSSGPHFGSSCINCSNAATTSGILEDEPTLLHCQCNPGTGVSQSSWPTAIIDLNTVVDNDNGALSCNNLVGNTCSTSNNGNLIISLGSGSSSTFTAGKKRAKPLIV